MVGMHVHGRIAGAAPETEAELQRARRAPGVRALRRKLNLTQEGFAVRFHLPLGAVRDWEQGVCPTRRPACCSP